MDARLKQIWDYGHGVNFGVTEDDLEKLIIIDSDAKSMVASWQDIMGLVPDSELGPKTEDSLTVERCGHPDHRAAGRRTFNDECKRDVRFSYDDRRRPSNFSREQADSMIANVVAANAAMGAPMEQVDIGDDELIRFSWDPNLGGGSVIGLAQLTNGSCSSRGRSALFCKINPSYARAGLGQMSKLAAHEFAHCYGFEHTRGGVMSPTIEGGGFDGWTTNDPSTEQWVGWYGGKPWGQPDPPPVTPPVTPDPELTIEVRSGAVAIGVDGKFMGIFIPEIKSGSLVALKKWEGV